MAKNPTIKKEKKTEGMRIDKWLKSVRLFKKRQEAADACYLGRVKMNDQPVKASRVITIGDHITVKTSKEYRQISVLKIPLRGLSTKDVQDYYHEEVPEISEETQQLIALQKEAEKKNKRKFKGRLTKKERRDWGKFHGL